MEVSIDQRNKIQKYLTKQPEEIHMVEEPKQQNIDVMMELEENKDEVDSFPDLFDAEADENNNELKESSESLIVGKLFNNDTINENDFVAKRTQTLVEPRSIELVSDDQVGNEIVDTVDKISDCVIGLTKKLHEIADGINLRYNIYQQQQPEAVWKKIEYKDIKDIWYGINK